MMLFVILPAIHNNTIVVLQDTNDLIQERMFSILTYHNLIFLSPASLERGTLIWLCLSVCLSVCPSVRLSVCPSVTLSFPCDNSRKYYRISFKFETMLAHMNTLVGIGFGLSVCPGPKRGT